jgi:hypothetical protein
VAGEKAIKRRKARRNAYGGLFPFVCTQDSLRRYTESRKGGGLMHRGYHDGGGWLLGFCAIALGSGILIAAIFPVGALLFLVAFLLIACGLACCRR